MPSSSTGNLLISGCEARKDNGYFEEFQWWFESWNCEPGAGYWYSRVPVGGEAEDA